MSVWELKPRTKAKLEVLGGYLNAWFQIIGKSFPRALYFDGFCGPGTYIGGESGSPIIALTQANIACERNPTFRPILIFNDLNEDACRSVKQQIAGLKIHSNIEYFITNEKFWTYSELVAQKLAAGWRYPVFSFIDPFGIKDTPFEVIGKLLEMERSECLINFMAGWANRFVDHPDARVSEHVTSLLGGRYVEQVINSSDRIGKIVELYENNLRGCAEFVKSFQLRDEGNVRDNILVFCSHSVRGFEKIKESMWKLDTISGGRFSAHSPAIPDLFEFIEQSADLRTLRASMKTHLLNLNEVTAGDLLKWVSQSTDYLPKHGRLVLEEFLEEGLIEFRDPSERARAKGNWPERLFIRVSNG